MNELLKKIAGADLNGADLRDADLKGADLRGADLRDTRINFSTSFGFYDLKIDLETLKKWFEQDFELNRGVAAEIGKFLLGGEENGEN